MNNPVMPKPYTILDVFKETDMEYTFKVATDIVPAHGQFMQLSIPKIGEAPISVSSFGDGYMEFTIRAVGKLTDKLFSLQPGDTLFMRGPYGKGWPIEQFADKHLVVIAGGTGVAPVRSLLNKCCDEPGFAKSVHLICGFKNAESILFKKDLERWKENFEAIYTLDNETIPCWQCGLVTQFIPDFNYDSFDGEYEVIIVGPPAMMHFSALKCMTCGIPEEKVWVSFERKMSCAVGKCGHCRIDETYVCLEGPVFNYTVAKNLLD